ncbi:MAG: EAL domain-containing protein [Rhodospirillales bacterium]|nr:EAL domain-containing protein [Rhodospirillales bacterium]
MPVKQAKTAASGSRKTPAPSKAQGSRLFHTPPPADSRAVFDDSKIRLQAAIAAGGCGLALMLIGRYASLDFTLIIAALMALSGVMAYDAIARRRWEQNITNTVTQLEAKNEKLTRELLRNRNEITALKDGLAEIAETVKTQGRQLPPAASAEGRMIGTIVERLSVMGDQPTSTNKAAIKAVPDTSHLFSFELPPPPDRAPPESRLDNAMASDTASLSDMAVIEMIHRALNDNHLEAFLQPVVKLPHRQPVMYEMLGRLRAEGGRYLPAARYLGLARDEALVPALDNQVLLRCLQFLRDKASNLKDAVYIINISAGTLGDTGFMNALVSFLSRNKMLARRLVFEIPQIEMENSARVKPFIDGLSRLGCRFSMDRVRKRQLDFNRLKSLHVRFIKFDAEWLIQEAGLRGGAARIAHLKRELDAAGIELIAEKVEKQEMAKALMALDIHYAQGYLYGKPDHLHAYRSLKKAA